jgi:1,2-diacylglycerol 3-alpha-glucosyltransferase
VTGVRALYVSDVYFPRVNGVSTSIRTFRTDLARLGVETTLVVPDYPGRLEHPEEVGVVRVQSGRVPGDPEDRRMQWRALQRVLAALPDRAFDIVHAQTPFMAHYAARRFARERGLPCVATYHTFFEEYLHHYVPALPRAVGRSIARAFTRSQCRDADALIAPSEPMRTLLAEYEVRTPIRVLPTGLPPDRFAPGNRARFRAAWNIGPGTPLLTYVGRVAHEKNIAFLLHVFAAVQRRVPEAVLMIAGEGPARTALEALAAQLGIAAHVWFVGYLERNSTLLDCYAAADAFVFASRTETQGLVLLEAMAQGTPVVSTAVLGTRSILTADCGALVVDEEVEAFAIAAIRLLSQPGLRQQLSRAAREHALRWSSLTMATRLADLYRDVVAAARGAPAQQPERAQLAPAREPR